MIKTLRITSIIVAILSIVFFSFPVFFGFRGDKDVKEFLNSPGVIEQFSRAKVNKAKGRDDQVSPLVKQAELFALYLDPPAKPKPRSQVSRKPSAPRRPPKVKAKFDLVGTSYYSKRPEQSLALIDEPGKGFRWVAQSEKVGHLVFEQIKDGVVVVRDGQKTFELTATRPEKRSLVKGVSGKAVPKNISETPDQSQDSNATDDTTVGPPPAAIDEGTKALMDMFVSKIRATQGEAEANGVNIEQNAEMMKKLVSDLRAMRISTEESNKLGDLGEELKEIQQDPNQPGPGRLTSQIKIMDPEIMKRLAKRQRSMKIEKPSEPNSPKKK